MEATLPTWDSPEHRREIYRAAEAVWQAIHAASSDRWDNRHGRPSDLVRVRMSHLRMLTDAARARELALKGAEGCLLKTSDNSCAIFEGIATC